MYDVVGRLDAAVRALDVLGPEVVAGEPWPLADAVGPEPETSWGPREVLAHVAEMVPFWMGEIELVIDAEVMRIESAIVGAAGGGDVEPPPFGRLEDDPLRISIINRDRAFPSRELLARIDVEARRVATRLRELDAREVEMLGRHARRGDMTVADIAEVLIVSHFEGHVDQLRETVASSG
jgi:hypothetical protein